MQGTPLNTTFNFLLIEKLCIKRASLISSELN